MSHEQPQGTLIGTEIAVVGMSCRFPMADDTQSFWNLLESKTVAFGQVPEHRWDARFLGSLTRAERSAVERGAFLSDVSGFDAAFFGISPAEAAMMDPQQRMLLELCWEALEDAGIPDRVVAGTRTGVFVGVGNDDYTTLVRESGPGGITPHTFTGSQRSAIANRVSYFLGMRGPSLVVDAGQASSLVAVHLAAESLLSGRSDLALAGGITVRLTPHHSLAAYRFGALSPDGHSHVFDARANGFAQGEGGGTIVLKRLRDALADGDDIYCVIRGSAVNNDGGGSQFGTPTTEAQAAVIRAAQERAGISPASIGYVELHGTGTRVGDPVEALALGSVIGAARRESGPLPVGSVKSSIGHLEAAAGIAGFIKTALCVRRGMLVPTAGFRQPNPEIDFTVLNLAVQTSAEHIPLSTVEGMGFGVSSFGLGGTNCHVVLTAAPVREARPAQHMDDQPDTSVPLVLSAAHPAALREQAALLSTALRGDGPSASGRNARAEGPASAVDVSSALLSRRSALPYRAVVFGATRSDVSGALEGLDALAAGDPSSMVVTGQASVSPTSPVFVFPGQGAQWPGMGAQLLDTSPVFHQAVQDCADALAPHIDWNLEHALRDTNPESLQRVDIVQPALWAMMIALTRCWEHLGITPTAVIGHSQGEIAAAHIAGILTLEDSARIIALRSQLIHHHLVGHGTMAIVNLPAQILTTQHLSRHPDIHIAAHNSPQHTVLAGDHHQLQTLVTHLHTRGIKTRHIPVDYPSHTHHTEALHYDLIDALAPITPHPGHIPFHSTLTTHTHDGTHLTPTYWYNNLRNPVQFDQTITNLSSQGHHTYLEPSPHPTLTTAIHHTNPKATTIPTLTRHHHTPHPLHTAHATAWTHGQPTTWPHPHTTTHTPLPTYPFQHKHHWYDQPNGADAEVVDDASVLGVRLREAGAQELSNILLDMVCRHTAVALGGGEDPPDVEARASFRSQGMTSASGVTLSLRLAEATGISIPPTAIFDHPTPQDLADHLEQQVQGTDADTASVSAQTAAPHPHRVAPTLDNDAATAEATADPVVIVAMACRFPGGITTPEALWDFVADERDAIGEFPINRGWDVKRLFADDGGPGTSTTRHGSFLHDMADFDASFFGISSREALAMDPQQRLLLETSYEAIERAGINPDTLRNSSTGVFTGVMAQEYGPRLHEPSQRTDGHLLTGSSASVASGRIAYAMGLEGPALSIDTACSSSLVALHLAADSLRKGECTLALAGGATVMSSPGIFVEFSRQRGLSADGRCKAFAAAADGTGWGEGVGVVLLERLSDARRNGHPVLAVLRGSAVNQDGASNGLTAPHGPSQQRLIRQALANAGLAPHDIDIVEAHGTGTRLGDPIEAQALIATYGQDRDAPLWLGSVKSNLGHTQAAAGVAGVIKMVMAMRHGVLPRTLHIDQPTEGVDWSTGQVRLLTERQPWPSVGAPRRAAVSSFGISGTNAHAILEQAPTESARPVADYDTPAQDVPWFLSARTEAALRAQASRLHEFALAHPDTAIADIGRALATQRAAFSHRAAVVRGDLTERAALLAGLAAGESPEGVVRAKAPRSVEKPVFVFPGQGAQWPGMGAQLLDTSPVFHQAVQDCADALAPHIDWNLEHALRDTNPESLQRVDIVQPALWAMMIALTRCWEHLGITPTAVIGHSQGEIAAAHIAGILTLEDSARIIALRSQLIHHPETLHNDLIDALAPITPHPGHIPFHSTLTTHTHDGTHLTPTYWYNNLRNPVQFDQTITNLSSQGHHTYLEPSPHPTLTTAIHHTNPKATTIPTLTRHHHTPHPLHTAHATAWTHGQPTTWPHPHTTTHTPLPTYPLQHKLHW
ncbi:type I polyketide synthase, partial [Streptomyces sp. NPDC020965]|uniref:type I polyketide synthase n=1 Tax=Streptomyces sp. NPDC020965 TaxID=3365105 RepID=UPI0037A72E35